MPLSAYADEGAFKLFLLDVGLLGAMAGLVPYYWSAENSTGEIDFLVQRDADIYPIEVKAEENVRARSLRVFNEANRGMLCRRFSLSGYRDEEWMVNVPLYAIGILSNWA